MSRPFPRVLQHPVSCVYGNQVHFLLGKHRGGLCFEEEGEAGRVRAMGPGLLLLAVLATLVSCEDPEGNRVFGERGVYRVAGAVGTWLDWFSPAESKSVTAPLRRGLAQGKWELACRRAGGC